MRKIQFVTAGFNPKNPDIYGPYLKSLVEALTEIDLAYLRAHPETPVRTHGL
jgi:hypothetical protein